MNEFRSPDSEKELIAKRHRKSSPFTQIYRYTCLTTGERLSGESHNERDFWVWLDSRRHARAIFTELDSVVCGTSRYTPDVAVVTSENELIYYEVKSDRAAQKSKFLQSFAKKVAYYAAHGKKLLLVRRSDFPGQIYLLNIKLLYVYGTGEPPSQAEVDALANILKPGESETFGILCDQLLDQRLTPHAIWYGLATRAYSTDLNQRISTYSIITRRKIHADRSRN